MRPRAPACLDTACDEDGRAGNLSIGAVRVRPGIAPTFLFAAASSTRAHKAELFCFADLGTTLRLLGGGCGLPIVLLVPPELETSDGNASTLDVAACEYESQACSKALRFSSESNSSAVLVIMRPVISS